jgi:hypothetical protein
MGEERVEIDERRRVYPPPESHETARGEQPLQVIILSCGEKQYRVEGANPVTVDENEDNVLQAFLERASMDEEALRNKSGAPHAAKVLKRLKTKFGGMFNHAIRRPGGKGKGGYHVSIRKE